MLNMLEPFDLDALPFQPSREIRTRWKMTRKEPMSISGINLPGLFRIDNFTTDSVWFFTVFVCEIIGLLGIASELDSIIAIAIIVAVGIRVVVPL
ncbi:MAG: hypothetical protein Q8N30_03315 [Methylococcales bacterium]|nr:hypothetical protein [Methylococcales bacterium]